MLTATASRSTAAATPRTWARWLAGPAVRKPGRPGCCLKPQRRALMYVLRGALRADVGCAVPFYHSTIQTSQGMSLLASSPGV